MNKEKSSHEKFQWNPKDFIFHDANGKEVDIKELVKREKERLKKLSS